DQPSINSPLDFQAYMSAEDVGKSPVGTILFSALLMLLGGGWLVWSGWKQMQPASQVRVGINSAMPSRVATVANRPQSRSGPAVPRSAGQAAFGRR
ncbi:MAG TPA: hypothetical protein VMX97_09540, partial [Hyphomicrobiaceae bacterium]|nr:hypothetical protein [Hyphomicrobiaceae bacterium]